MATFSGTSSDDKVIGTSGNDTLSGMAGYDILRGGSGNDAFVIRASDKGAGHATSIDGVVIQDFIQDFSGAGTYTAGNNDFISLLGFGTGATISESFSVSTASANYASAKTFYYTIHYGDNETYSFAMQSLNGHSILEKRGDYNFYG